MNNRELAIIQIIENKLFCIFLNILLNSPWNLLFYIIFSVNDIWMRNLAQTWSATKCYNVFGHNNCFVAFCCLQEALYKSVRPHTWREYCWRTRSLQQHVFHGKVQNLSLLAKSCWCWRFHPCYCLCPDLCEIMTTETNQHLQCNRYIQLCWCVWCYAMNVH